MAKRIVIPSLGETLVPEGRDSHTFPVLTASRFRAPQDLLSAAVWKQLRFWPGADGQLLLKDSGRLAALFPVECQRRRRGILASFLQRRPVARLCPLCSLLARYTSPRPVYGERSCQ